VCQALCSENQSVIQEPQFALSLLGGGVGGAGSLLVTESGLFYLSCSMPIKMRVYSCNGQKRGDGKASLKSASPKDRV
jgi:hypothetical protein